MLLDPLGDVRYDNTFTIDFRIDRPFRFGTVSLDPGVRPVQPDQQQHRAAINRKQAATNANTVSGIMPPRVARFGINVALVTASA